MSPISLKSENKNFNFLLWAVVALISPLIGLAISKVWNKKIKWIKHSWHDSNSFQWKYRQIEFDSANWLGYWTDLVATWRSTWWSCWFLFEIGVVFSARFTARQGNYRKGKNCYFLLWQVDFTFTYWYSKHRNHQRKIRKLLRLCFRILLKCNMFHFDSMIPYNEYSVKAYDEKL